MGKQDKLKIQEKTTTITIEGKDYILKNSLKAAFLWAEITRKEIYQITNSLTDGVTFFYCLLKVSNGAKFRYTLDEFTDVVEADPEMFSSYADWVVYHTKTRLDENGRVPVEDLLKTRKGLWKLTGALDRAKKLTHTLEN